MSGPLAGRVALVAGAANGLRLLRIAIDTHLITSHHALPLLIRRPGRLVAEITDGTTAYNAEHYRVSPFYDLAKVSVKHAALLHLGDTALPRPGGCRARARVRLHRRRRDPARLLALRGRGDRRRLAGG